MQRVKTKLGLGTVVYVRNAPPSYTVPEVYSICLDEKKKESEQPPFRSYSGTIFPADEVEFL